MATSALDYPEYLDYLKKSKSQTCQSIIVLTQFGATITFYKERCSTSKDFVRPEQNKEIKNPLILNKLSPNILRSLEVDSKISEMWIFLMPDEPSAYRCIKCICGFAAIEPISFSLIWIQKLLKKKVSMGLRKQLQKVMYVYRTVNVDVNLKKNLN